MARKDMIANRAFRYGTRMLQADAEVSMTGPQARLHEALGDVRPMPEKKPEPQPKRAKRKKKTAKK